MEAVSPFLLIATEFKLYVRNTTPTELVMP